MTRRTTCALAAALAAPLAALLASAPAHAVGIDVRDKWAVETVDVRGILRSRHDANVTYHYDGRARYESSTDEQGIWDLTARPGRLVPLVADSLEYNGISDAKIVEETGKTWSCGTTTPKGIAPTRLPGIASFTRTKLRVNWTLMAPAVRCEPNAPAWSHVRYPTDATIEEYPLRLFRGAKPGRLVRLYIDVSETWTNETGTHELEWYGKVVLEKLTLTGRRAPAPRRGRGRR